MLSALGCGDTPCTPPPPARDWVAAPPTLPPSANKFRDFIAFRIAILTIILPISIKIDAAIWLNACPADIEPVTIPSKAVANPSPIALKAYSPTSAMVSNVVFASAPASENPDLKPSHIPPVATICRSLAFSCEIAPALRAASTAA